MQCRSCGSALSDRARFCLMCGEALLPDVVSTFRQTQGSLSFLRLCLFAMVVSGLIFPPLFRALEPATALKVRAWSERLREIFSPAS